MKLAFRALRRKPAFAAVAILTIALAIAANTALFSAVYAVLIQPLPFRDPSKLVQIWETYPAIPQMQAHRVPITSIFAIEPIRSTRSPLTRSRR